MPFRLANGAVALSGALASGANNSASLRVPGGSGGSHVVVAVHVTAVSGSSPTLSCKLQESDDASSWSDVTGAAQAANLTAAGNTLFNGHTAKQFVRVVGTVGGTATPTATATVTVFGAAA